MKNKIFLQVIVLIIILLASIFLFKVYFTENLIKPNDGTLVGKNEDGSSIDKDQSQIQNLEYTSTDQNGNTYKITSKRGSLDPTKLDIIIMQDVIGLIRFNKLTNLKIISDNAVYNVINYDSNFYNNVVVKYDDHLINSDSLDLIFNENMLIISDNIIYKNKDVFMYADKIEFDLITKDMKIFMNEDNKKIRILNNTDNGNN